MVTGTTVAAFEPALDYLVVKLPRFPFDKFPRADRSLGSQMKATGEVMAIDRTFGSALNKALRGLEQAGAGPLAEDPAWLPTLDYLAAALAGDPDEEDAVIRWIGEDGEACESTRLAQRSRHPDVLRRFLAPSDNRLWRVMALLRRGGRRTPSSRRRGSTRGSWRARAIRWAWRRGSGRPAAIADPTDPAPRRSSRPPSGRPWGPRDRRLAGVGEGDVASARAALGLAPGYAMVDNLRRRVRRRDALSTAPTRRPAHRRRRRRWPGGGPRHRLRPGSDRAGNRVRHCAVRAAESLRGLGWEAVLANSNPETVSTDFDASSRLYFGRLTRRAAAEIVAAETAPGADRCRPSSSSAARRR